MNNQLTYLFALMRANLMSYGPEKKRLFIMSLFMFIQTSMFFVLWVIFFNKVGDIKGWRLEDVARMFGIVSLAVGLALFFFNGVRSIAYRIHEGTLDGFITKPRAVLPALMMSQSSPSSIGDVVFGPMVWLVLGNVTWSDVPLLVFVSLLSMVLFLSVAIIVFSTAFWLKGNTRFSDQMFEMLIIASANIIHGQPFGVKLIAFTVLPAGFISYLPTELVRQFDWMTMGALLAATVFYAFLAVFVFNAGLRRYVNSLT